MMFELFLCSLISYCAGYWYRGEQNNLDRFEKLYAGLSREAQADMTKILDDLLEKQRQ